MTKTILHIPDAHVKKNDNLDHWTALGNFTAEMLPDRIVNTGDGVDLAFLFKLPAMNASDTELENLSKEIYLELEQHGEAQQRLFTPLRDLNERRRSNKKKLHTFTSDWLEGNHDKRAKDFVAKFEDRLKQLFWGSKLLGNIDQLAGFNLYDNQHPYTKVVSIDGIMFSHNFRSGTNAVATCDGIRKVTMGSAVCGHVHRARMDQEFALDGRPAFIYTGGVFFRDPPPYYDLQYTGNFACVTMLQEVDGTGYFEINQISVNKLLRDYL